MQGIGTKDSAARVASPIVLFGLVPFAFIVVDSFTDFGAWFDIGTLLATAGSILVFVLWSAARTERADERYRRLVEHLPLVTYVGSPDPSEPPLYIGPQIETLLRIPPEEYRAGRNVWVDCLHPEDRDRAIAEEAQRRAAKGVFSADYRLIARDGRTVWIRDQSEMFRNEEGKAIYLQGFLVDVTAQKQAAINLSKAERRYRSLVERIPVITYADQLDERSTPIYISPRVEQVLGYTPEDWTSDTTLFRNILHPDDQEQVPRWHAYSEGDAAQLEYRVYAKDGRIVWLRDEFVVVQDAPDEAPHIEGFLEDITKRKAAEAQLRESEERFRTMLDSAAVGILLVGPDRRILVSNGAFEEMTGYTKAELSGTEIEAITHPDDEALSLEQIRDLASGSGHTRFEKRYLRKDGRPLWARVAATAVRADDGNLRYMIGIVEDMTDRMQLEEELRHAQKMEAVGRLAGGIAHDFNNLLLAIRGYSELALADIETSPEDAKADVEQIKSASETAASLTGQLLAFSRKQVLQPQPVDLTRLVAQRMSLLKGLIDETVEVKTALEPALQPVRIDELQMEQALVNVVVNARDAMEGAGLLTIETANVLIGGNGDGPALSPGRYVRLSVSDTGSGMNEETRHRAFEPFFTTKGTAGTGLGLSTVDGFVRQSEGHLVIESTPGSGTTLDFYFPAVDESVAREPHDAPKEFATAGSETILLVEDEHPVRQVLRESLLREGYTILEASNGEEAVSISTAHDGAIDVLVTDVVMPRMGGVEAAQTIVAARPGTPVIYMSGHLQEPKALQTVQDHGIFLQKPFAPSDLARKIRELLDS